MLRLEVFPTARAAELELAREVAALVRARGRVVLGLAAGATPVGAYAELVRLHRAEGLSFAGVVAFHLDELEGLPPGDPRAFGAFLRAHLLDHIDLEPGNVHLLPGDAGSAGTAAACAAYEAEIRAAGGIDLQVLGLGANGHVGFNEPGSPRGSRTRRVGLHPETRAPYDAVAGAGAPTHALTMGVATILAARKLRMLALGERKAAVVAELFRGAPRAELPATFLREHPDARLLADAAAAARLPAAARAAAGPEASCPEAS